jgi:hypothetical protein
MTNVLILLTTLALYPFTPGASRQAVGCTVPSWLAKHPADSSLGLVAGNNLDNELRSQGTRSSVPPPDQTLRGIGADVIIATIIDSSGIVVSTDPQAITISRYQGGVSPEEVRRWTPQFDSAAVLYLRGVRYSSPTSNGSKVVAFHCVTVHYTPIPAGKKYNVSVSSTP